MKFLKNSKISKEIELEVTEDEKILKLMLCEEEKCILEKPKIISKISPSFQKKPVTPLYSLFHGTNQEIQALPYIHTKFYVLNIQPYDPREFV